MTAAAARVVWVAPVLALGASALMVALPAGGPGFLIVAGPIVVPFALVGALIVARRPTQPLGWLLVAVGLTSALTLFAETYFVSYVAATQPPPGLRVAYVLLNLWFLPHALLFTVALPRFPTGRVSSRRWRVLGWGAPLVIGIDVILWLEPAWSADLGAVAESFRAGRDSLSVGIANPGPFEAIRSVILAALVPLSFASVIVRYRRAAGAERAQIKWLGWGAAVALAGALSASLAYLLEQDLLLVPAVGIVALPVSIGMAVLRHRLFDIDRLVSRSVAYALVTGGLVALFVLASTALGFVMPQGADGPVPVAAATLATAAAFRPLARRVQNTVDRRFDRARYDAARTTEEYRARLRTAVDLDRITADLVGLVHTTVQPSAAAVWLRERRP